MTVPSLDRSTTINWATAPACPFRDEKARQPLQHRESPYWHALALCRHIGIYKPNKRVSTWLARVMTLDGRYVQHRLGSALSNDADSITYDTALELAVIWFESGPVKKIAQSPHPLGRADGMSFCPWGPVYTVGAALKEYLEWSQIARSAGSHYNNIVLINFHLTGDVAHEPLEEFNARHLRIIAQKILATHSTRARGTAEGVDPSGDITRRAKRTFNCIITILRMAFRLAWDSGRLSNDLPLRCLHRISVPPAVRTLFLNRDECRRLLARSTPALARLVLAGLYTGCRVGELANLRVRDVGREVYGVHVAPFKCSPARFVFLPDEAMAFFLECCDGKTAEQRILLSDKNKTWSRQHANLFRRAVKESGLPREFVFHGLRHTYASDLVRNEVPLSVVARQLGHADTRSVAATYGHLAEQFREEQVRERFTPLSEAYTAQAAQKAPQLQSLWHNVHGADWRAYGRGIEPANRTPRSSVRTPSEVLEAFGIR